MGKKRVIKKGEEKETSEELKRLSVPATRIRSKEGNVYISSSYNNTIVSLTDLNGNILYQTSSGALGFKGNKKATPFAASKVGNAVSAAAKKIGVEKVSVLIKGIGSGRDSALRSIAMSGLDLISIKDVTPIAHNGCRPRKVRRV